MVGYHQTNQKTDTGKTLTRWPVLVDHNNPSLLAVITIVAMGCFYNLNEKMYVRIVEEIELRKRTA